MAQDKDKGQDTDKGTDLPAHDIGTGKGEEASNRQGKEAGRHDTGKDEAGRPTGTSTARDSTSVNVEEREPIDPEMPNMPPA
ncbi:MAG: hypothetical protein H0X49_01990 [Acidobacteria bacterium]|nr:hypothetical protein [Acidobacteriota bacterium]